MSECARAGKWIGGCRFEPRYDVGNPDLSRFRNITGYDLPAVLNASKPKTYVHDVCARCGKVAHRPTTPTTPNSRSGE